MFLFYTASAQKNNINRKDSLRVLNPKYFYDKLDVDKKRLVTPSLPVDSIYFVDARFDTTFIALNWRSRLTNGVLKSKYNITGGLASGFTHYFNDYYTTSSQTSSKLICFVKEFSITWKQDLLDHFMQTIDFTQTQNNNIHVEIECYYQMGEKLYPAARIDSIFKGDFLIQQTTFEEAVKAMLNPFQRKIEHLDTGIILKRKFYTLQQINERYTSRFQIPVLTDKEYKRGIYKSITDFRNNTPSTDSIVLSTDMMKSKITVDDFFINGMVLAKIIQKRNTAVFIYNKNKELIEPSSIFAFCDGTTFWIQHGASYYPLVRVGNAFEFIYTIYNIESSQLAQHFQILMPLNINSGHSNL